MHGNIDKIISEIENRWILTLSIIAILAQVLAVIFEVATEGWPKIFGDAAMFQHGGWYITQGAIPYVDFWDVKPPLIYFTTAILAILSGGDMVMLHIYGWILSASFVVGTSLLAGLYIYELKNDKIAGLAGGVTLFVLTQFYGLPRVGMYPQFYSTFFAILTLYLLKKERYLLSGVAGALSAGYYYPEGIVMVLSILLIYKQRNFEYLKYYIFGIASVTALIMIPFILWDNLVALIVQTVLAPILTSSTESLGVRLLNILFSLGPGVLLIPVAMLGWKRTFKSVSSNEKLIGWGGIIYSIRILSLGPGSQLHMMAWMIFVSLGFGVVISTMDGNNGRWGIILVLLLISTSLLWSMGPFDLKNDNQQEMYEINNSEAVKISSMQEIYWGKLTPETCHYRLSDREIQWLRMTNGDLRDKTCGEWPNFLRLSAAWKNLG